MRLRETDEKTRIDFERSYIGKRLGSDVIEAVAEVVALIWVTMQIINHLQPVGQFVFVQQIVSRSLGSAGSLVNSLGTIDEDLANLFDYQEFMQLPAQNRQSHKLKDAPELIEVKNVSFHYPKSDNLVLDGVSLTIEKGQHIAIVGENGAGKSTLIKLLTGLYLPVSGEVLVDGKNLKDINSSTWHSKLSVLQQDFIAYSFATARDNIYFGDTSRPLDQDRFDKAIDKAEARGFLDKLPKGIESYVNQWMEDDEGNNGTDLSGGQWQRLALARNFYRDSPIIILDEPTSAIDALAESRIFKHLFADHDHTVIAISHRLTTIKKADVIYMLKDGKLVEQGGYEELVGNKAEFYAMFESQLK